MTHSNYEGILMSKDITISKNTLILLLDTVMALPYMEVAPILDQVYGEVGDQLSKKAEEPKIILQ